MSERERQDLRDRDPIDTAVLNAGIERGEGIGLSGTAGFGGSNDSGDTAGSAGGPATGADILTGGGAGIGGSEIAGGTSGAGGGGSDTDDVLLDAGVDPASTSDLVRDEGGTRGVGGAPEGDDRSAARGRPAAGADWAGTTGTGQVGERGITDLDTPD